MKILIVSCAFMPSNSPRAFRTTELAKQLARLGNDVDVYIPQNNYDYTNFNKEYPSVKIKYIDINFSMLNTGGNKIKGTIAYILNRLAGIFLQLPDIKFYTKLPKIFENTNGYDAMITIAVPHPIHWGMANAIKKNPNIAKKWIADCGDPFMLCKTTKPANPFYFKYFEKSWCRRCDYISVPTEGSRSGYYQEFSDKIRVIPQGFNFQETQADKIGYEPNKVITFCYSGSFILNKRDIRPILNLLSILNIDFNFHVYTKQEYMLEEYKDKLKGKLFIHSYIPRKELFEVLCKSDFLLNLENGTGIQTPSKLIDYALSKRPILSLDSNNLDIEKFKDFLNRDYSKRMIIEDISQYDIRKVANQFLELME